MTTNKAVKTAMLSALSIVLMYILEFPLPIFPPFLKLDFSNIPALIAAFAFGPLYGSAVVLVKSLVHIAISSSGGIGELADFLTGCALVLPAGIIYGYVKTKKWAILSLSVGVVLTVAVSIPVNYFIIIPFYENMMPLEQIIGMCSALMPAIKDKMSLIIYGMGGFNLIKAIIISAITLLIYKPLSPILHKERSRS